MKILFGKEYFAPDLHWENLAPLLLGHEIIVSTRETLASSIDDVDIVVPFWTPMGRDLLQRGKFGLIQQFGVGLDLIDVHAATEAGIWVARLPAAGTGNADSVAEHAILLMLSLSRHLKQCEVSVQTQRWGQPSGNALLGKTVCIVGLGDIGSALAIRLNAFGMQLIGVRQHPERGAPAGTRFQHIYPTSALHTALHDADYVIASVNYDQNSHHLFNEATLAAMKPGAYLINIARGGLVDHDALLQALESGHLAGAGLDVFWEEPVDPAHPLFQQNVVATPHIAGITDAFYQNGARVLAENIARYARGETLRYVVNQPARPRYPLDKPE
ncbi:hypothetical protein KSF_050820 [Reticulibacter mediterranei]|uniref:Hydroxyacid dehydrogenase n=1 Tax=Reticulibacter mediterranei TaxID=2778369 RepID=A0A8J3N1B8_9CHLR|nr:2-hydroxyacid dehydrogenase [Reticulibacter mediterranei]GHO95034.1 hypothetical protein KSF_050820 [Reticulibacter mediterranei]